MSSFTLPCLCANLRRAARTLTQFYEDALRPLGLSSSQFTILQALAVAGSLTQGRLGQILGMDSTTLTRTLAIMRRHRWIARRRGADRREWHIAPSASGKALFQHATPHWEKAQAQVRRSLGEGRFAQLTQLTTALTDLVTAKGEDQ